MKKMRSHFEAQILKHFLADEQSLQQLRVMSNQKNENRIEKEAINYLLNTRYSFHVTENVHKKRKYPILLAYVPIVPLDFETNIDQSVTLGIKAWEDGMVEVALMYFDEVIQNWSKDKESDVASLYYALVNRFDLLNSLFKKLNHASPVVPLLQEMMQYQQLMKSSMQREYRYALIEHISRNYYETDYEYIEYITLKNEAITLIETRLREEPYYEPELYMNQMMNQYFDLGQLYIRKLNDISTARRYLSKVLKSDLSETSARILTKEFDLFRKGQTCLLLNDTEQALSFFDKLLINTENEDWPLLVHQQLEDYYSR